MKPWTSTLAPCVNWTLFSISKRRTLSLTSISWLVTCRSPRPKRLIFFVLQKWFIIVFQDFKSNQRGRSNARGRSGARSYALHFRRVWPFINQKNKHTYINRLKITFTRFFNSLIWDGVGLLPKYFLKIFGIFFT